MAVALNKSKRPSMLKIVEKLYGFIPIEIIAQCVKWTLANNIRELCRQA